MVDYKCPNCGAKVEATGDDDEFGWRCSKCQWDIHGEFPALPAPKSFCGHCGMDITEDHMEPDYEFEPGSSDKVIDHGERVVYKHLHSEKHLCDGGGTGAIPVEDIISADDHANIQKWLAMRKARVEQAERDAAYDKLCEEAAQKEYDDWYGKGDWP